MTKKNLSVFVAFAVLLFAQSSSAATVNLVANMDCSQASAGAGTCGAGGSGTGLASLTYDDVSNLLSWEVTWSGLSGTATSMHFHGPALPNQNAGVRVALGIGSNPSIGSAIISDDFETELLSNLWYVNLHTSEFGGGEIRGQINVSAVPIPAAVWLFGSALAGLGWMRRKQTV